MLGSLSAPGAARRDPATVRRVLIPNDSFREICPLRISFPMLLRYNVGSDN